MDWLFYCMAPSPANANSSFRSSTSMEMRVSLQLCALSVVVICCCCLLFVVCCVCRDQ